MSLLLNENEISLISHELFIQTTYNDVNGEKYRFNQDLFAIHKPFKSYETNSKHSKKKRNLDEILDSESFPARTFNKYQDKICKILCELSTMHQENSDSNNEEENKQVSTSFKEQATKMASKTVVPTLPTESNKMFLDPEDNSVNQQNSLKPNQTFKSQISLQKKQKLNRKTKETITNQENNEINDEQNSKIPNLTALNAVSRLQTESTKVVNPFSTFNGSNLSKSIIKKLNGVEYLFPSNCRFICNDVLKLKTSEFIELQQKFDVIVMDPPWTNKAIRRKNIKQTSNSNKINKYGMYGYTFLNNDDIEQLPIDSWLSQNGVVFVWCTNSPAHRKATDRFFTKWKLTHVGIWYWLKVTKHGEPIMLFVKEELNMKQPYELIVIGARGDAATKWRPYCKQKLIVSIPSAMHSHKPPLIEVIRDLFKEEMKCLEVFARYLLPGWTSIGNEVLKLQNLCFYENVSETTEISRT